jgi:hypothetical protein
MNNLARGQEIIRKSMRYYLKEMAKLHKNGFEDEDIPYIEDWFVIKTIIDEGEPVDKESLLIYFGDIDRVEYVISFYKVIKYLGKDGATF